MYSAHDMPAPHIEEDMYEYIQRFIELDNNHLNNPKVRELQEWNHNIIKNLAHMTLEEKREDARVRANILLNLAQDVEDLNTKLYSCMTPRVEKIWTSGGRRRNLGLLLASWGMQLGLDISDHTMLLGSKLAEDFKNGYDVGKRVREHNLCYMIT